MGSLPVDLSTESARVLGATGSLKLIKAALAPPKAKKPVNKTVAKKVTKKVTQKLTKKTPKPSGAAKKASAKKAVAANKAAPKAVAKAKAPTKNTIKAPAKAYRAPTTSAKKFLNKSALFRAIKYYNHVEMRYWNGKKTVILS